MLKPNCVSELFKKRDLFQQIVLDWFREEGQSHPWRETQDPWAILVSEIMLQQTTVAAVRAGRRFELFLEEFPDLQTIAAAPEEQLLKAWEGLGYYNRVRNLQKTALAVIQDWGGEFPRSAKELETLPGVGPYTAGAIASFAFNEPSPIVDGNIARVLSRIMDDETEIDSTIGKRQLWEWAEQLLDPAHPRLFNSGIMEIGQTYCRPKKPECLQCPVATFCKTRNPEELPKKKKKAAVVLVDEHALLVRKADKILLTREEGARRKGFYRLPLRSQEEVADLTLIQTSKYAITKHRVTLHLYEVTGAIPGDSSAGDVSPGESWHSLQEVADLPMPSPIRRALEQALKGVSE